MAQFVPQLIKRQTMNSGEKIMSLTQDQSHSLAWGKWPPYILKKKKNQSYIYSYIIFSN